MNAHHDWLTTLPIVTLAAVAWWFLPMIENASHWAAIAIPFVTLAALGLQCWVSVRKLRR
jgi:lipoprotein signal peptidase